MHSPFYVLVWVAGVCSLWLLWDRAIKSLLLALFREQLFEQRYALFHMGMEGDISFNSDLYRQLEMLLCGLLRFGHRVTLLTYIFSKREQEAAKNSKDYIDVSQQIALKVSRLDPVAQGKLIRILQCVQRAIFLYMAFTSLWFLTFACGMLVAKLFGLYRPDEKAKITGVIQQEAYRAESKRGISLSAAATA